MPTRRRLLLLQLPRLDPDVATPGENVMLAAACLRSALARAPEGARWQVLPTPAAQDTADNAGLLAAVRDLHPDVIGATLYLWNVERTLRLLAALKRNLPQLLTAVGGPEVAREHPLLFPPLSPGGPSRLHAAVDAAVVGEGETVFPAILAAIRDGTGTDWNTVAWRRGGRTVWGTRTPPCRPLAELAPPADDPVCRPDAHGMAYLETNRGCPMRCAFCCYNLRRKGWSSLPPADVARRIRVLRQRGSREIRLVDPTFNAHPDFRAVLAAMRRANAGRRVKFFVELRADTLTEADAAALAAANVAEAEVGVQSTDPAVLRRIHRPTDLARLARGIERLRRHGIRPTIDFMYGLPGQGPDDMERSLAWLARYPDAHPQFLPVLLLPGTELRDRRDELGLRAQRLPPYRVLATDCASTRQLREAEDLAVRRLGGFDTPTRRFVGRRLRDLFEGSGFKVQGGEGKSLVISHWSSVGVSHSTLPTPYSALPTPHSAFRTPNSALGTPHSNRRTVIFRGNDLFVHRGAILAWMRQAVRQEPDVLWQFVLAPAREEPLDLLDAMIAAVRRMPSHWLDRLVSPPGTRRLCARRVFVLLPSRRPFDKGWVREAAELLEGAFH